MPSGVSRLLTTCGNCKSLTAKTSCLSDGTIQFGHYQSYAMPLCNGVLRRSRFQRGPLIEPSNRSSTSRDILGIRQSTRSAVSSVRRSMVGRVRPPVNWQFANKGFVQGGIPKSNDLSILIRPILVCTARATWQTPRLSTGNRLSWVRPPNMTIWTISNPLRNIGKRAFLANFPPRKKMLSGKIYNFKYSKMKSWG